MASYTAELLLLTI